MYFGFIDAVPCMIIICFYGMQRNGSNVKLVSVTYILHAFEVFSSKDMKNNSNGNSKFVMTFVGKNCSVAQEKRVVLVT